MRVPASQPHKMLNGFGRCAVCLGSFTTPNNQTRSEHCAAFNPYILVIFSYLVWSGPEYLHNERLHQILNYRLFLEV